MKKTLLIAGICIAFFCSCKKPDPSILTEVSIKNKTNKTLIFEFYDNDQKNTLEENRTAIDTLALNGKENKVSQEISESKSGPDLWLYQISPPGVTFDSVKVTDLGSKKYIYFTDRTFVNDWNENRFFSNTNKNIFQDKYYSIDSESKDEIKYSFEITDSDFESALE